LKNLKLVMVVEEMGVKDGAHMVDLAGEKAILMQSTTKARLLAVCAVVAVAAC